MRESLLDHIGCVYAGWKGLGPRGEAIAADCAGETGSGLIVGLRSDAPLQEAVFLNGLAAHALDMDDGVNEGIIHLGSPIFAILLPLAALSGAGMGELLGCAAYGYEAAWTLARSIQPAHKLNGWHATGTCGCVGAAAAAARLLGLDREMCLAAVSAAALSATGMLASLDDASQLKPYNVGKAALLALTSVQMARSGFKGPDDALGGRRGFLPMLVPECCEITEPLIDGRYAVERTYTKSYAACRYCHPAIDAAIEIGGNLEHDSSRVERIEVTTYSLAVRGHDNTLVKNPSAANMSTPYGVAVGFITGRAGLAEYSERMIADARVRELASRVSMRVDEGFSARFPQDTCAKVTFFLDDESHVSRLVEHPKGEPENPLGREGVEAKFSELVGWAEMPADWAGEVVSCVFDEGDRLDELIALLGKRVR